MTLSEQHAEPSSWPHYIAVALVCATFPLIWVGGLVTTYDAGMAVPDWPTTYGYNMFLYPWSTWIAGPWDLFIEHGHRLLGSLVGMITIVLNVAIWKYDSRKWMRWIGLAALLLVILQGLLGGLRVRMASTELARAHGCTGPLFFAFVVGICVMTSKRWRDHVQPKIDAPRGVLASSYLLVLLAYVQLVLGAHLRHPSIQWSPSQFRVIVVFHVVTAVVLFAQSFYVARGSRKLPRFLSRPALLVSLLIFGQVLLGVATWRAKYGWPTFIPVMAESSVDRPLKVAIHNRLIGGTVQTDSMAQAITVTSHVALGSLILATSACYATRLSREFARYTSRCTDGLATPSTIAHRTPFVPSGMAS